MMSRFINWNSPSLVVLLYVAFTTINVSFAFCPIVVRNVGSPTSSSLSLSPRQLMNSRNKLIPSYLHATVQPSNDSNDETALLSSKLIPLQQLERNPLYKILQLMLSSLLVAFVVISWEDLSMAHPMRKYNTATDQPLASTVRGLAFGQRERQAIIQSSSGLEPENQQTIPSYNEIMLQHRTERVPMWEGTITKADVLRSVSTIQRAVLSIEECKTLASNYEWETLSSRLREPILHSELETACGILKRADAFLSSESRDVVGFDWASCAWRHCGAFADAQEAIDELDHLIGILEPFEGLFILDIVERSFRDVLAVTRQYADPTIILTEYKPLQRMSDGGVESEGTLDEEYLAALQFLRETEE